MISSRPVLVLFAVAVVALSLTGCHAGAGPHASGAPKIGAAPTPSASAPTDSATPSPGASASASAAPAPAPPPAKHTLPSATPVSEANYEVPSFGAKGPAFNSPSLNLHCGILDWGSSGGYWGCAADKHTWTFPSAAPGDPCYQSEINCGDGIEAQLGGPVGVLIAGDLQFPGSDLSDYPTKVLPYGKSVSFEGVTCASESEGVTCIETASGHGFFISKVANDIF